MSFKADLRFDTWDGMMFTVDILRSSFICAVTEATMLAKTEPLGPVVTKPDGIADSRSLRSFNDRVFLQQKKIPYPTELEPLMKSTTL